MQENRESACIQVREALIHLFVLTWEKSVTTMHDRHRCSQCPTQVAAFCTDVPTPEARHALRLAWQPHDGIGGIVDHLLEARDGRS